MAPRLQTSGSRVKKGQNSTALDERPRGRKKAGKTWASKEKGTSDDTPSNAHTLNRFRRDQFQPSHREQPQHSTRRVAHQNDNLPGWFGRLQVQAGSCVCSLVSRCTTGYQKTARTVVSKDAVPLKTAAQVAPPFKRAKTEVLADYFPRWKLSAVDREAVRLVPMSPPDDLTWCPPRYELDAAKTAASWRNPVPLSDESEQSVWVGSIQEDDIAAVFF